MVLWSPVARPESSQYPSLLPLPPLPPLLTGDEAGDREDEVPPPTNPANEEEEEVPPVPTWRSKLQSCIHIDIGRSLHTIGCSTTKERCKHWIPG